MLIITTTEEFTTQVLQANLPVLVDFWATWCGPCRMMMPIVEQITKLYQDRILVAKVDVDQNSTLASQYNIISVPTFMLFQTGKPLASITGGRSLTELQHWIETEVQLG